MTIIRPISDLRNKSNEISQLCHSENEPIYITRGGKEDLVVLSHAHYEQLQLRLKLYEKLSEAEMLEEEGDTGISHEEMMARLRNIIK